MAGLSDPKREFLSVVAQPASVTAPSAYSVQKADLSVLDLYRKALAIDVAAPLVRDLPEAVLVMLRGDEESVAQFCLVLYL